MHYRMEIIYAYYDSRVLRVERKAIIRGATILYMLRHGTLRSSPSRAHPTWRAADCGLGSRRVDGHDDRDAYEYHVHVAMSCSHGHVAMSCSQVHVAMMSCSHGHVARIVRHSQLASGVVIHVAIASVAYSTSGGAWSCGMQNGW